MTHDYLPGPQKTDCAPCVFVELFLAEKCHQLEDLLKTAERGIGEKGELCLGLEAGLVLPRERGLAENQARCLKHI